jgi:predicted transcriptional regulator
MREISTDGDRLLKVMSALANRHRLRVIAALSDGRNFVSQLARDLRISRPLLMLHLQKLEEAGLIVGQLELSDEGRAMKYYTLEEFVVTLTPETISQAAATLPPDKEGN